MNSASHPLDNPSSDPFEAAAAAASDIARLTGVAHHDIAVTLGSGWGNASRYMGSETASFPATQAFGFTQPVADGHDGMIRSVRTAGGANVLVMGARTHYYEGYGVRRVVHGVRTAAAAGARTVILTNGAGGLRQEWSPGQPVLISDHINLTADSPLEGASFVDLTDLYSSRLRNIARSVDPSLEEGVYAQFRGPHYETAAEGRWVQSMGASIVGMSTALEAIAARQVGMEVLGLSLITVLAAAVQQTPASHDEVLAAGRAAEPVISRLLAQIVEAAG